MYVMLKKINIKVQSKLMLIYGKTILQNVNSNKNK